MDNALTAKDAEDFEDEVAEYEAMEQDPKRPLQDMYLGVEKFDDDENKPVVDQPVPPPSATPLAISASSSRMCSSLQSSPISSTSILSPTTS